MKLEREQTLLRVHLDNSEQWRTAPLYEALVERARRTRLAGATVLAGAYGYVGSGPLVGDHAGALRTEHPVVIEIVDGEAALLEFLEVVEPMLAGRSVLVTLERAQVVRYRSGAGAP